MGPDERDRPAAAADDDLSIVPGLEELPAPRGEMPPGRLDPALDPDRYDPVRDAGPAAWPTGPLDPALDPDRYDPGRDAASLAGPLDPALDPDRYDPRQDLPPGQGQTLTDLLGEGAHEDSRDNYQWALGLLGVVAFIALVSWFFGSVVSP